MWQRLKKRTEESARNFSKEVSYRKKEHLE
jgi:hypothetical protein